MTNDALEVELKNLKEYCTRIESKLDQVTAKIDEKIIDRLSNIEREHSFIKGVYKALGVATGIIATLVGWILSSMK